MSNDSDEKSESCSDVGSNNSGATTRRRSRKGAADQTKVDLRPLLFDPVPVKKQGKIRKMDAFEAMLRKQVEQAVNHRSPVAIKAIIEFATEYDLFETPPPVRSGGVLIVSIQTIEEIEYWTEWYLSSREVFLAKAIK